MKEFSKYSFFYLNFLLKIRPPAALNHLQREKENLLRARRKRLTPQQTSHCCPREQDFSFHWGRNGIQITIRVRANWQRNPERRTVNGWQTTTLDGIAKWDSTSHKKVTYQLDSVGGWAMQLGCTSTTAERRELDSGGGNDLGFVNNSYNHVKHGYDHATTAGKFLTSSGFWI